MAEDSTLRASDADRDRVAGFLREHFAAGRLSEDELDERLAAVYSARTDADLATLTADLPHLPPTPAERRSAIVERRVELRRQLVQQTGGGMIAFAICTAIWLATGANGSFWPIWVAIFTLIPLIRNGWRLYGPAPELDRVERELARHRGSRHRHHGARGSRRL